MKLFPLHKSSLLLKSRDYNRVYQQGKRLQGRNYSIILAPNHEKTNRLGISIHGQVKGAVRRNRIKRIIREFYRLNQTFPQKGICSGTVENCTEGDLPSMDIVFTVRNGFDPKSPAEVMQSVESLFRKDDLLNLFIKSDLLD